MKRRKFIIGTAGALSILTGCVGGPEPRGENNNTSNSNNMEPEISESNFQILSSNCGDEVEFSPKIEFDTENSKITVIGKANGKDACQTVSLETLQYNSEEDYLEIILQTQKRESSDACAQCITEIEYETVVNFEDEIPQEVYIEQTDMKGTNSSTGSFKQSSRSSSM